MADLSTKVLFFKADAVQLIQSFDSPRLTHTLKKRTKKIGKKFDIQHGDHNGERGSDEPDQLHHQKGEGLDAG